MKYYQVRHIEIQLDQVYLFATGALAGVIHLNLAERYRIGPGGSGPGGSGPGNAKMLKKSDYFATESHGLAPVEIILVEPGNLD